jgi:hypothetical protein
MRLYVFQTEVQNLSLVQHLYQRDSYETGVAVLEKIRSSGIGSTYNQYWLAGHPPKPSSLVCDRYLSAFAGSSLSPNGQRTQMRHPLIHP